MPELMAKVLLLAVMCGVVSGVDPRMRSSEAKSMGLRGEGGRSLQEGLCNSIGCSDGLVPIPDAQFTPCTGGVCTEDECCEAFCSSFPCPGPLVPIPDAQNTLCPSNVCTADLCCVDNTEGGDPAPAPTTPPASSTPETGTFCNSIGCSNGVPIPDAQVTLCTDGVCTEEQCCEAFCSSFPCPGPLVPISDPQTTLCPNLECSQELCCEALCSGFSCPSGYIPIVSFVPIVCPEQECTTELCCVFIG